MAINEDQKERILSFQSLLIAKKFFSRHCGYQLFRLYADPKMKFTIFQLIVS